MSEKHSDFFQDFMPENVCFGCGAHNPEGLHIKSKWDGEVSVCKWMPEEKYHGWSNLLNGGVLATLIDCHCMCTAMAEAYRREGRALDSFPEYRYATGTMNIRYLKPTSTLQPVQLEAKVVEVIGKKMKLTCEVFSKGIHTVSAEVIAIRVYDSSQENEMNVFKN